MSRDRVKHKIDEPSRTPFGFSAGEARLWLKRGEMLGALLTLLLRRERVSAAPRETSAPRRATSQPRQQEL